MRSLDVDRDGFTDKEGKTSSATKEQWRTKGLEHFRAGRYAEALEAYEQALCLDPNDVMLYRNKGLTLNHLHRYEEAIDALERFIERHPGNALAYANIGYALNELKR